MSSKKKGALRFIEIDPTTIPTNCNQIVISQNKSKIVIKNDNCLINSSVANKHELIMKKVKKFFDEEKNFQKVRPILLQESDLSLRLLDWSTTNFSRKNTIMLTTTRNGFKERINMFLDYKAHLKAFSKRSFDPFCRRERIMLTFATDPEKRTYVSTAAQMNFLKWSIESGVLDYCTENLAQIEADMVESLKVKTQADRENISKVVTANVGEISLDIS
tara:strand:- start:233 stop:886 length:654 start_codon:yes stop_codon:yes gene_type:complete